MHTRTHGTFLFPFGSFSMLGFCFFEYSTRRQTRRGTAGKGNSKGRHSFIPLSPCNLPYVGTQSSCMSAHAYKKLGNAIRYSSPTPDLQDIY
ncbi:hypothetical protein CC78DRAFT_533589 [Lojkania enalia]|uniref:Uncharacterized protein n=1 Tax=Lojkania enalia TaxID=147567 RepID=A0A9P4KDA7_9PLEO|nr:hypothetical protein CC78DRAFT_533589 [Didymosphaeria enalia]